jgi:hypothetical protein
MHSPMSRAVIDHLRAELATGHGKRDVAAKIGDSITVSGDFFTCFARDDVKLGGHADLEATRAFFAKGRADPLHDSFTRKSLAATIGWQATKPIEGNPSPLDQEIDATTPATAIVMYGTNDAFPQGVAPFAKALAVITDRLLARGVIPILETAPPRRDDARANVLVEEIVAITKAIAESRQVPLVDLHAALAPLPRAGLKQDGIHPGAHVDGIPRPCWFDAAALQHGMNQRNLRTLEALDRVRRFVFEDGTPEPDDAKDDAPQALPAHDGRLTTGHNALRVRVERSTYVRARLVADKGSTIALGAARSSNGVLELTLEPGEHSFDVEVTGPTTAFVTIAKLGESAERR